MIISVFVFNRFGDCIYSGDCQKPGKLKTTHTAKEENSFKLAAGLVHSVKHFIQTMTKKDQLTDGFFSLQTSLYKLHHYESLTGYRFVVLTDPSVQLSSMKQPLRDLYGHIFVEHVAKDPSYQHAKNCVILNENFHEQLLRFVRQLPFFDKPE